MTPPLSVSLRLSSLQTGAWTTADMDAEHQTLPSHFLKVICDVPKYPVIVMLGFLQISTHDHNWINPTCLTDETTKTALWFKNFFLLCSIFVAPIVNCNYKAIQGGHIGFIKGEAGHMNAFAPLELHQKWTLRNQRTSYQESAEVVPG